MANDNISQILLQFRLEYKLTQGQLAEKLGATQAQICEWETGVRAPTTLRIKDIVWKLKDTAL